MINKIEKNYMYISITFLLLAVYVVLFPFISKGLESISPQLTQCQYKRITGKDCPLCGGTRYMRGIGTAFSDITYLFNPFGYMMLGIIFELFFRIYCIYKIKKKRDLKKIIIFDIVIHLVIIAMFFTYEITFVYNS